jgi:hypothetical protein
MPTPPKYSNDDERHEARRAHRRKWYNANKQKQLLANMRFRHRTNPPKYLLETDTLRTEIATRRKAFEAREALLLERLCVMEGWDPKKEKEKALKN